MDYKLEKNVRRFFFREGVGQRIPGISISIIGLFGGTTYYLLKN